MSTTNSQSPQTFNVASSYQVESSFTLQTKIGANTTVNVYEQAYTYVNSNYVVFLNTNLAEMFLNASYADADNDVLINLNINASKIASLLNTEIASVMYLGVEKPGLSCGFETLKCPSGDGVTLQSTNKTLGFRLLEIAAVNIFSNAKARAAIKNDLEFEYGTILDTQSSKGLYASLADQINAAFQTDAANIFNQYVNTTRYTASVDANQFVNFNFKSSNIQVMLDFNFNTLGLPESFRGRIGSASAQSFVHQNILLMLTDSYKFSNVPSDGYSFTNGGSIGWQ